MVGTMILERPWGPKGLVWVGRGEGKREGRIGLAPILCVPASLCKAQSSGFWPSRDRSRVVVQGPGRLCSVVTISNRFSSFSYIV